MALNWKPEPEFGGFYAAKEIGAFQKKNLSVTILPGGSGTPVIQMVAAGRAEFGIVSGDELVIARDRGSDLVALFAVYQKNPQGLMAQEDSTFKSPREVFQQGATLAIQKGLPYGVFLERKFGFSRVKVVPYPGGIASFLTDKNFVQQCFVFSEPLLAEQNGIKSRVFLFADLGFNPYTTVVITTAESVRRNRKNVELFVAAIQEGWKSYLQNPKAANAVMSKLNPTINQATMDEMSRRQKSFIESDETKTLGLGAMTQARWQELSEQIHNLGLISRVDPARAYFLWK